VFLRLIYNVKNLRVNIALIIRKNSVRQWF